MRENILALATVIDSVGKENRRIIGGIEYGILKRCIVTAEGVRPDSDPCTALMVRRLW